jgi:hypothetical protein
MDKVVYRVYGVYAGREENGYFGAYATAAEAHARADELRAREVLKQRSGSTKQGGRWALSYHNQGFVVQAKQVETSFQIPTRKKPRDCYHVRQVPNTKQPGRWETATVEDRDRTQKLSECPKRLLNCQGLLGKCEPCSP